MKSTLVAYIDNNNRLSTLKSSLALSVLNNKNKFLICMVMIVCMYDKHFQHS